MNTLRIDVYSHYFRVSEFDKKGKAVIGHFLKDFKKYEMQPDGRGGQTSVLMEVYASFNHDKSEFRLAISVLQVFIDCCKQVGYRDEDIRMFTHAPVKPVMCDFTMNPNYQARDDQPAFIEYLVGPGRAKMGELQTGKGKAQPLDAMIKVPQGWKTMGEMVVGDEIIAKDGSTTKVTGVYPQGQKEIFRIYFGDGRYTEACGEHLWKVYRPNRVWEWKIVNTFEMIRLKELSNNRLHIDLIDPEEGKDIDLPIAPYTLGILLGDGCFRKGSLEFSTADEEIVQEIRNELPENLKVGYIDRYDYRISRIDTTGGGNEYISKLTDLGLWGKLSHQKFIPSSFLHGSKRQRLALLQGLMDSDGTASVAGSPSFSTTSRMLADTVCYLVRSLGGIANVRVKSSMFTYKGERKTGRISYVIGIRHKRPTELFRLKRKQALLNDSNQYSAGLKLSVERIVSVGFKEAQCISIAHQDRLYVTDNFIVTHNTVCACIAMSMLRYRTFMTIKPMYIEKWIEDFKELLGLEVGKDILVIEGGAQLRELIKMARTGKMDHIKVIIASNATVRNYIDGFERSELAEQTYDCRPEDLMGLLGIGLGLVDEFHQDFNFNFRMDMYRNIEKTIELSATVKPDDPFMAKMYAVKFPKAIRYSGVTYDRYIDTYACFFSLISKRDVRYLRRGRQSYSHVDLEKSILRNRKVFANYKYLLKQIVEGYFITDYQPGQRLLVFASTIQMCSELTKYLKETYPRLDVRRYCEKDPYENVRTADICVSTPGSAGTAIDIPDLVDVCNTVAIGSRQANEQLLGRLRKVKNYPGRVPRLFYFVCTDIPAHLMYHSTKKQFFADKVSRQNVIRLKGAL